MIRSQVRTLVFEKRSCIATRRPWTFRGPLLSGPASPGRAECEAGNPGLRHIIDCNSANGFSTGTFFRFTIGQGMAAIAGFALAFAFLPMPVAIVLSIVTLLQVLRSRLVQRRLSRPDPCMEKGSAACLVASACSLEPRSAPSS